ncbi:MAG: hypothetical protein ACYC27_14600 [Armatimonadota bacterium]
MKQETTADQFLLFQKEFNRWVEIFGLKQWEVIFTNKPDDDGRAGVDWEIPSYIVKVNLSTIWYGYDDPVSDDEIRISAFHEACELLLAPIHACMSRRYLMKHEVEEELHVLIRTLENTMYERYRHES